MFTLKLLYLYIILINISSSTFVPTTSENELKYWSLFQSWCNAYGKSYDPSIIQDKFNSFKENYDTIVKENSLNNAPFVTISYDASDKIDSSNLLNRKLFGIEAATVEVKLPSYNDFNLQSLNQFSDLSHGEFISYYTGLEGAADITILDPAETGNNLNDDEIAGVVIGSVIGGLAIIGGLALILKRIIKRKTQEKKIKKVFSGINLYDLKPGQHQSITGRGVPIDLTTSTIKK